MGSGETSDGELIAYMWRFLNSTGEPQNRIIHGCRLCFWLLQWAWRVGQSVAMARVTILGFMIFFHFSVISDAKWKRHIIDDSSRGADGVRVKDVNGDGYLDLTTGWEEGGVVRVTMNPGPAAVRQRWPSVTVGEVASPEDAVFVDLDRDGAVDVVSCCEGSNRSVFIHWAPREREQYLEAQAWTTAYFPATRKKQKEFGRADGRRILPVAHTHTHTHTQSKHTHSHCQVPCSGRLKYHTAVSHA